MQHGRSLFFIIFLLLSLQACRSTQYLEEGEHLLKKSEVSIVSVEKIKNLATLEYELSTVNKDRPNRKWLGIPREWLYYKHTRTDRNKWDLWVLKNVAEEPALFDSLKVKKTAASMALYLKNKGYFDAHVAYQFDIKNKKASVSYTAYPEKLYRYENVTFASNDTTIKNIVTSMAESSFLKKGQPVDENLFNLEARRIERALRNMGYFDFASPYILPLEADSIGQSVRATSNIATPSDSPRFVKYHVGNVSIHHGYDLLRRDTIHMDSTTREGVYFIHNSRENGFDISKKALLDALYLQKGKLFRQEDIEKTRQQLNKLGIYKYIKINPLPLKGDTTGVVHFDILLLTKQKMLINSDFSFNTAQNTRSLLSIGTEAGVEYRNRNLFKGAELFGISMNLGVEYPLSGNSSNNSIFSTINFKAATDLTVPKFIDVYGITSLLHRTKLMSDARYKSIKVHTRSRVLAAYEYQSLIDAYSYNSFHVDLDYQYQPDLRNRILYNPLGLNFVRFRFDPAFEEILKNNIIFFLSSENQFFSGIFLKNFHFAYSPAPNLFGEVKNVFASLETSGVEAFLLNKAISPNKQFTIPIDGDTLHFNRFVKMELEARYTKTYSNKTSFATRGVVGVAFPFGYDGSVPFVKQFYLGGPSSMRAWDTRSLGTGGFNTIAFFQSTDSSEVVQSYNIVNGDFKLEMNAEYRFQLPFVSFLKGAVFLDVGNVWGNVPKGIDIDGDGISDSPKINLTKDFWKQLAVGTGAGLRLDFSYFVIRLDVGIKVKNPYETIGRGYWAYKHLSELSLKGTNWNLAIGYPF